MTISERRGSLSWAHVGDLHIIAEHEPNYRDFQSMAQSISPNLAGQSDFCAGPGRHLSGSRLAPHRNGRQW
jgi:hypothetical protein